MTDPQFDTVSGFADFADLEDAEKALRTINLQNATVQDVTATDDGTGTGTIDDPIYEGLGITVQVDADGDANHIVVLPSPAVGLEVTLIPDGSTGYELRSSAPATVAINAGTGAGVESAIAATDLVKCICTSATTWVCYELAAIGTPTATPAAS